MRREFSKKTKLEAWARCEGRCECCTAHIIGTPQYDHILPDAFGGEPTLENCAVLCAKCHRIKTGASDMPAITKSVRVFEKRVGARRKNRGFQGWRRFDGTVVRRAH